MATKDKPIAFLIEGNTVLCNSCVKSSDIGKPGICGLYFVNIYPYKQSCHNYGTVLCKGQTDAWCELFSKRMGELLSIER